MKFRSVEGDHLCQPGEKSSEKLYMLSILKIFLNNQIDQAKGSFDRNRLGYIISHESLCEEKLNQK